MLCDKSVFGVNQEKTQQWLLNEIAWLTLQKAYEITLSLESAIQQAAGIEREWTCECIQGEQTKRILMFLLYWETQFQGVPIHQQTMFLL